MNIAKPILILPSAAVFFLVFAACLLLTTPIFVWAGGQCRRALVFPPAVVSLHGRIASTSDATNHTPQTSCSGKPQASRGLPTIPLMVVNEREEPGPIAVVPQIVTLTKTQASCVAHAELNNVRWVSHCRDLVQLPAAA